jgi:two-component system, NarL family, response regulator YdfI
VTRVLLIAAPGRARERLEDLLDSSGVEIVGRANDLEDVQEELAEDAEVVLIHTTAESPEELLDSLQRAGLLQGAQVVLLTDQVSSLWVNRAIRAGLRGILPEEVDAEQLAAALDAVARGLVVLHPGELRAERASRASTSDSLEEVESLTTRERDVLQMLSQGLGNKEIAARLKISEHTVKFHVASILGKLGASTRTEAVSLALRRGLILL